MNQITRQPTREMTANEFLGWPGDGTGRKFELVDGRLRPVSPASPTHGYIQLNLGFLIKTALGAARLPLRASTETAVIPGREPAANVRVPDVVVTAEPDRPAQKTIPGPVLLVEILSPGNQSDTRENVRAYQTTDSVLEILVIDSVRVHAEIHRRQPDGLWPAIPEVIGPGDTLRLTTVRLASPIEDAYADTWLAG